MRKQAAACAAVIGGLVLPAAAQAHVSLHPNTLPAGSNPTIAVRVPSEETSANTVKVAVQFPPGFLDAPTQPVPGWTARVVTKKLATPVTTDEGTVSEEVSEVIWSGGKIPPEHIQNFIFTTAVPDNDTGKTLEFKTIQTYDNGKVVHWIGPASADEPSPTVNVTPKGGVIEDVAGTEAGPGTPPASETASTTSSTKSSSSDSASKGLGIAALVVGILGLIAGLAALVIVRSRRGSAAT